MDVLEIKLTAIYVDLVTNIILSQKNIDSDKAKREAVFQMFVSQLSLSEAFIGNSEAKQILSILNSGIWKFQDEIDEEENAADLKRTGTD